MNELLYWMSARHAGTAQSFRGGFKTEVQHPGYWTKGAA